MSSRRWRLPLVLAVAALSLTVATPAFSVSQADVDRACGARNEALAELRDLRAELDAATEAYVIVNGELERVTLQEINLRSTIERQEQTLDDLRDRVVERAVELYMAGGAQAAEVLFFADDVEQLVTGKEFLEAATREDISSVNDLTTIKRELERLRADLERREAELRDLRAEAEATKARWEEITTAAEAAYRKLDAECVRVYNEYQRELARRRALAEARRRGAAGGLPASATPGFVCPMDPPLSFINDWGFPRSGGRTHKGTDIFASMGHPVKAVASGTVRLSTGRLGGTSIWLTADYGTSFYYAHLSGYAPGLRSGQRVSAGQVIGYNGNSGNARGGPPHVHFQIHPGGGAPVNPYYTLRHYCG